MFEILLSQTKATAGLTKDQVIDVTAIPMTQYISGLGRSESGDLVATVFDGTVKLVIYSKSLAGFYELKQTINTGNRAAGNAIPVPGGFAIANPYAPTGGGSIGIYLRQPDGIYAAQYTVTNSVVSGTMGASGGLEYVDDWLFSAQADQYGTYLLSFKKTNGVWNYVSKVTKPTATEFGRQCIRMLSPTEIVTSAANENVTGAANGGVGYILRIDPVSGAKEIQRILPSVSFRQGYFGSSIVVINSNRIVFVARDTTGALLLFTFSRPDAGSPFIETSYSVTLKVPYSIEVNNFIYRDGKIYGTEFSDSSTPGKNIVFTINESGVTQKVDSLTIKGTVNGEYFASSQTIIEDKIFYASSFKGNSSKPSTIGVYSLPS